jgi:membrane protein YqaA with SNARE-associated domain
MLPYILLFLQCFASATIFPLSSEAVVSGYLLLDYDPTLCLIAATSGNWLGGMTTFFIARMGKVEWIEKWFRVKHEKILKFEKYVKKYGAYFGLFVWLPIVGEIMELALGFFKAKILPTALFSLAGRLVRYSILIYFFS